MKIFLKALVATLIGLNSANAKLPPLKTVESVDIRSYMGKWYEISSIPQRFSKGCIGSTAFYELRDNGDVSVTNECWIGSFSRKKKKAEGKAWIVDMKTNSKLKVQFFWPFSGDYWILELGENYEFAVVGSPNRDYLWVLSRTPELDRDTYSDLIKKLKTKHLYDVSLLKLTPQQPK